MFYRNGNEALDPPRFRHQSHFSTDMSEVIRTTDEAIHSKSLELQEFRQNERQLEAELHFAASRGLECDNKLYSIKGQMRQLNNRRVVINENLQEIQEDGNIDTKFQDAEVSELQLAMQSDEANIAHHEDLLKTAIEELNERKAEKQVILRHQEQIQEKLDHLELKVRNIKSTRKSTQNDLEKSQVKCAKYRQDITSIENNLTAAVADEMRSN